MQMLSKKISMLSFWAMVCVVMIHSQTVAALTNPASWNVALQRFLGGSLTCWAVPFFFMVSGFFYVKTLQKLPKENRWMVFCEKKLRGLVVPYLLWVLIGTVLGMPLLLGANVVAHRPVFSNTVLANGFGWKFIADLLGIHGAPMGNFPLWYMRSLILLFVLSPVWCVFNKLPAIIRLLIAFGLSLYDSHVSVPVLNVMLGSIGYFIVGMVMAECKEGSLKIPGWVALIAGGVAVVIAGCRFLNLLDQKVFSHLYEFMPYALIAVVWYLYDVVATEGTLEFKQIKRTFWVYCLHNAVVQIFPTGAMAVLGKNDCVAFCAFLVNPVITIVVCLVAAALLCRVSPRFYSLLTGGRA